MFVRLRVLQDWCLFLVESGFGELVELVHTHFLFRIVPVEHAKTFPLKKDYNRVDFKVCLPS